MSDKKQRDAKPSGAAPGRSPELAKEMCTCGHRAGNHVAFKYTCQAPGNRKGYCPCMRFIPRKENTAVAGEAEETPKSEA